MRRMFASTILSATVALAAALAPSASALALGGPAGGFVIPAGSQATFTAIQFNACNNLTWGYQLNGGANQNQATFPGGCGSGSAPDVTIGPFATPTTLRVYLTDNTCRFTYYSDGLPVDHVIVSGMNPYSVRFADSGGFCEHTTTTLNTFSGCNLCITVTIPDQRIAASGTNVSAAEGQPFTGTVATFTDPDPNATAADYAATISWGDGTGSSAGVISGTGPFMVSGSHTFGEEGSYQVTVTIADVDTPANSATASSTAAVADAALTASQACSATNMGTYNGPTATFVDAAAPSGTVSDFTASIDWGDGSTSAGTVSGPAGGPYSVGGSHSYSSTGAFTIKTTVTDVGGSSAEASCTTVGFSFAPGGGSFAIGGQHSGIGGSVTFWSAQWATLNPTSGLRAASSFKGFAKVPSIPVCGAAWSTDPGNSAPPPAGPLPLFMGVIVTNSATQARSTLSGNVIHIVVVKTNPGYAPDPGHAGTGTVVAVVC